MPTRRRVLDSPASLRLRKSAFPGQEREACFLVLFPSGNCQNSEQDAPEEMCLCSCIPPRRTDTGGDGPEGQGPSPRCGLRSRADWVGAGEAVLPKGRVPLPRGCPWVCSVDGLSFHAGEQRREFPLPLKGGSSRLMADSDTGGFPKRSCFPCRSPLCEDSCGNGGRAKRAE